MPSFVPGVSNHRGVRRCFPPRGCANLVRVDDVRFSVSVPRDEYDSLVRAAGLEERSLAAEVRVRLRRSLGGEGAPAGVPFASSDRVLAPVVESLNTAAEGTGGGVVPVRAVATAPRSSNGLCPHGRDPAVCETPACKAKRQGRS